MTAPAHPDRQGTREELAAALDRQPLNGIAVVTREEADRLADALLPVVERLCDQRAAEALESPEQKARISIAVHRAYQRGRDDGIRAATPTAQP